MPPGEEIRPMRARLVALAAVAVVLLGFWGFDRYDPGAPVPERFYRALQLFVLESGDASGALPWQLELARLAAPALTVVSAALATAAMSRNRIDRWRARRRRGHVVVCGLDARGIHAALALAAAGHQVVTIERDPQSTGIGRCRRAGIPVIVGDARDPVVLARAGVGRADHLVLLTQVLGLGGEVALAAVDLVTGRDGTPLTIHLEVDQPELAALVRAVELAEHRARSWRLEELDLAGVGARVMLDEHAPWASTTEPAHVVVVGASPLGLAVVTELARRWRPDDRARLVVTAVDPDPDAWQRLPRLRGVDLRIAQQVDTALSYATLRSAAPGVSAAYVCLDDEPASLTAALAILRSLPDVPVVVRLKAAAALAEVLRVDEPGLRIVSLEQRVLTPTVLLDATVERIARALHDSYRRSTDADNPSAVAWDRLPEQLKQSNRAQAANVADKLRLIGCLLVPDDGDPSEALTEREVDVLGQYEHVRWVAEREAAGWTAGPRDATARTTPYLVPWDELDEDVREIDRRFVRALPEVLAGAGLVLRRPKVGAGPGDPPHAGQAVTFGPGPDPAHLVQFR